MVRYLTREPSSAAADPVPTDDRDPSTLIPTAVATVLEIAETWLAWDGTARYADGNAWTPHKALRRVTDHLVDHLAEIECRLAGVPSHPDHWHGRMVTLDADWARFTELDLDEATSRLTRLADCFAARLSTLPAPTLDTTLPAPTPNPTPPDPTTPPAAALAGATPNPTPPNPTTPPAAALAGAALPAAALAGGSPWTIRQIAFHVSGVTYYATCVGRLTPR